MTQPFLQHEARNPGAGVEHGQNKERLEHDGEVIPDGGKAVAAECARKNLRHPQRKRRSTAGPVEERVLSHTAREVGHVRGGNREIP